MLNYNVLVYSYISQRNNVQKTQVLHAAFTYFPIHIFFVKLNFFFTVCKPHSLDFQLFSKYHQLSFAAFSTGVKLHVSFNCCNFLTDI